MRTLTLTLKGYAGRTVGMTLDLLLSITARFSGRDWVQNRLEPVSCCFFFFSGTNFPLSRKETRPRIFTLLADWNLADECSCLQREKRSRACKIYDAYRIIALYRELFDICRFASTPTYSLFRRKSARTPRGQKVKVNKNTVAFWNVRTKSWNFP